MEKIPQPEEWHIWRKVKKADEQTGCIWWMFFPTALIMLFDNIMMCGATPIPNRYMPVCSCIQAHNTAAIHNNIGLPGKLLPLRNKEWWSSYSYIFWNYLQIHFSTSVKYEKELRQDPLQIMQKWWIAGSSRLNSIVRARHRLICNHKNSFGVQHELCPHIMPKILSGTRSPRKAAPASFPNYQQVTGESRWQPVLARYGLVSSHYKNYKLIAHLNPVSHSLLRSQPCGSRKG